LSAGDLHNVRLGDLIELMEGFGFREARTEGSHHVFVHPDVAELVNVQNVRSEAKPYQIRQFLRLVERYNLRLKDDA